MRLVLYSGFLMATVAGGTVAFGQWFSKPSPTAYPDIEVTRSDLVQARDEGEVARKRAEKFEAQAAQMENEADKFSQESAALAARIQQAEAGITEQEMQLRLIARERKSLQESLAIKQQPLVELTAALQRLSQRPAILAVLRPGSVRDTVYMRALLATMLPEIEQRTASLKIEIAKAKRLEGQLATTSAALRKNEKTARERRQELVSLETQLRLSSREIGGRANREADRAIALAEESRDLRGLVDQLLVAGSLREELAQLQGPVLRPANPNANDASADSNAGKGSSRQNDRGQLQDYILPVAGRLVQGYGVRLPEGEAQSKGILFAVRSGGQVVAPASGRVVFANTFKGYGRIVILEHGGGWSSLITGLGRLSVEVGQNVSIGSPLGLAGAERPQVGLELRRGSEVMNPLDYVS